MDRRELNSHWSAMDNSYIKTHQHIAIFLPVLPFHIMTSYFNCTIIYHFQPNPRLSATRNQLRQKLAKFTSKDFAHLIIDLLKEIRRRHFDLPLQTEEQPKLKKKE